jgi:hypothetical protein
MTCGLLTSRSTSQRRRFAPPLQVIARAGRGAKRGWLMNWQQVWSTLLGTVAGFVFSIALFYLTERVKHERDRKKILSGLKRELEFDVALHASWLKGLEEARPQVAAGDKNIFLYLEYTRILSVFLGQALRDGMLYDMLTDDELVGLDKALRNANPLAERDFTDRLEQWKTGQIDNGEMFKRLEFHKFVVGTSKTALEAVVSKVKGAR